MKSIMNVRLATQVLSESVGKHLYTYHGPECHGTTDLCMMMDTFLDLLNIKNDIEPCHQYYGALKTIYKSK